MLLLILIKKNRFNIDLVCLESKTPELDVDGGLGLEAELIIGENLPSRLDVPTPERLFGFSEEKEGGGAADAAPWVSSFAYTHTHTQSTWKILVAGIKSCKMGGFSL